MNKSRVLLLLLTSAALVILANTRITSARWLVDAGPEYYIERTCVNGMIFAPYAGVYFLSWEQDYTGEPWKEITTTVTHADATSEPLVIKSVLYSPDDNVPINGLNHLTQFQLVKWENSLVPGDRIGIIFSPSSGSDFYYFSDVESCVIPESLPAPSRYNICNYSTVNQPASSKIIVPSDLIIVDLDIALESSYAAPLSSTLIAPNNTQIKLFNHLTGINQVNTSCSYRERGDYDYSLVMDDEGSGLNNFDLEFPFTYGGYNISNYYAPIDGLSTIDGKSTLGNWDLSLTNSEGNSVTDSLLCWCVDVLGYPKPSVFLPLIINGTGNIITNQPPYAPSNPSPANLSTVDSNSINLNWNSSDPNGDAVTYDVYFEAGDTTPDILTCDDTSQRTCSIPMISPTTDYYWQVIATDEHGAAATGPIWNFRDPLCVEDCEKNIPAGAFMMGCDENNPDESCQADEIVEEGPPSYHIVTLDTFRIETTKVTNAQYARCVADGTCDPPDNFSSVTRLSYYNNPAFANYPVIHVSWYDATNYCSWAGKRLPTEAEWEKAARGPSGFDTFFGDVNTRVYPWGDSPYDCSVGNVWAGGDVCVGDTTPVNAYPAGQSPYGVFEMVGNVREWANDWYEANYYSVAPNINPPGPEGGTTKLLRGSAWGTGPSNGRIARRINEDPSLAANYIGFRCVSDPID